MVSTTTANLVHRCLELIQAEAQYRMAWIIFDRDRVVNFDKIIENAYANGIHVGWSNPCFEIWLFAYFGSMPAINESWILCQRFATVYQRQTGIEYSKADSGLYQRLIRYGDEQKAIMIASNKYQQHQTNGMTTPSLMCPATTVYPLIEEIRNKVKLSLPSTKDH